jgi:peptidoglycan hydrolase-like protein with peptidoglycan-binding domain
MKLITVSLCVALLAPALVCAANAGGAASKSKTKTSSSASSKKSPATAKRRSTAKRRAPARPSYQTHPTPERYKEIQQSLADKGYFKGEVNGVWGADSTEALKRFQSDHKLSDDGKITSLSLIQLGLGPKHESAALHPGTPEPMPALPSVTETPSDTAAPQQ